MSGFMSLEKYLKSTEFFNFNKHRVREKALEIIDGLKNDKEKAVALFYWVRDEIKYNMVAFYMIRGNFKASVTLRRKYGFCVSKAVLLSSFARAVGIPARIHLADIINHKSSQKAIEIMRTKEFLYHGYSEFFLDGKWVKATPVFDSETSIKVGFLPLVEFDGVNDGLLPNNDIDGNLFVEYTRDRGDYAEIPYDDIDRAWHEKYGHVFEEGFSTESFK